MLLVDYCLKDLKTWITDIEYKCNNEISVNSSTVKWFWALVFFWVHGSQVAFLHRYNAINGFGVFAHHF